MPITQDSPLAQAFAAFFAMLIAAIADHAAEHPLLARPLRASIRRLEACAAKLQSLIHAWEQDRLPARRPRAALPRPTAAGRPCLRSAPRRAPRRRGAPVRAPPADARTLPERCPSRRAPAPDQRRRGFPGARLLLLRFRSN